MFGKQVEVSKCLWHCWITIVYMLSCFSHVWLFVTPWTIAHQAPLFMGFSRQDYWSGLPFPPPGDLPSPGIKPESLVSPAFAGGFFTTAPPGNPNQNIPGLKNLWHFSLPTEKTPNLEAIQSPPHGSRLLLCFWTCNTLSFLSASVPFPILFSLPWTACPSLYTWEMPLLSFKF